MATDKHITLARLHEVLQYNPRTGKFTRIGNWGGSHSKLRVGTYRNGYLRIRVDGRAYSAHHLAWFWMTGIWPKPPLEIDHRNRIRDDNRWKNLQLVTKSEQLCNKSLYKNNKSGILGVYWNKRGFWVFQTQCRTKSDAVRIARYAQSLRN